MVANIKTLGKLVLVVFPFILPISCNRKEGEKGKVPQLILIASPSYGAVPLLVRFEVETIPEKNVESYVFDFGDGERKLTKSKEVFHLYKKEGEFTASVSAYFGGDYPVITTAVKIKAFDNAPFDVHIEKNQSILLPDFPSSISITVDDPEGDSVNCEINGERKKFSAGTKEEIRVKYPESERNVSSNLIWIITSDFIHTTYIMCEDNFGRGMTETVDFLLGKRLMYADDYNIFVGEGKFGIIDEFVILHDDIEGTKLTYYRGEDERYEYKVRRDDLGNANVVLAKPYQGIVFLVFSERDIISDYKTYLQIGITYKGINPDFDRGIRFPVEITFPSYFPIDIEIFDRKLFLLLGKNERHEVGIPTTKIYLAWSDKITDSANNSFQLNLTEVGFSEFPLYFGFIEGGKMVKYGKSIFIMLNSSSGLIILSWNITENRLVDIFSPFKEYVFCYDMVNEGEHNRTSKEEGTLNLYCEDRNEKLYFVKIPVRNGKTSTDIKIYRDTSSYGEKVRRAFLVGSQKVVIETEKGKVFITELDEGNIIKTEKLCSTCTGINLFRRAGDLYLTFLQSGTLYITKIMK